MIRHCERSEAIQGPANRPGLLRRCAPRNDEAIGLRLLAICSLAVITACSEPGERRFRYAEAVEVPVEVSERDQLAALLAGFAQRNGLSFHDTSPRAKRVSNGRQTLALLLQRPLTSGREWNEIEVTAAGNAPALVTFVQPLDKGVAEDSARGRAALIGELRGRWPATRQVPLSADGGLARAPAS